MTKAELINKIATATKKRHVPKNTINTVIDHCFDILGKSIKKDGRFTYPNFGTWTVRRRKARKGRNPQTGTTINIPASRTIGFKPSPDFKKSVQ
jgi:DNA-binding protein HU-beta